MMSRLQNRICTGALLAAACIGANGHAAGKKAPESAWDLAVSARQTLEQIPPAERKRTDYTLVMDAYRAIYHGDPSDLKSPDAIYAVAELLADEGRVLHSEKDLRNSIGQFEFLRKSYPRASIRIPALYAEGLIAQNDLHDTKLAEEKFALYLQSYPQSDKAPDARAALEGLKSGRPVAPAAHDALSEPAVPVATPITIAQEASSRASAQPAPGSDSATAKQAASLRTPGTPSRPLPANSASVADASLANVTPPAPGGTDSSEHAPSSHSGKRAVVSGIRHWSTPTYTRVAIDLGDDVKYEAARVPHPDRIFFDLHGARLASDLVGKSFAVTDDGFLKRIRVAQFSNDVTRVVLDVNDVTEYSAFLLPNPYRLIIDIHGETKSTGPSGSTIPPTTAPQITTNGPQLTTNSPQIGPRPSTLDTAIAAKNAPSTTSSLPAMANTSYNDLAAKVMSAGPGSRINTGERPAAPVAAVPSTTVTHTATTREVASLNDQPLKQSATNKPTSKPIAAVVVPPAPSPGSAGAKHGKSSRKSQHEEIIPTHAAIPTAAGQRSLVRALGLKIGRIVIDAGHGGHDSGTLGAGGIMEKDVVLDVALRLGNMLQERLGAEIVYTRSDDTFIPLEARTAIANKAQADLFISVHANSSKDDSARGVEVYYLNFTSQPDALDVAARENAVSNQSIGQLADLVKKITLKDKIDESREFAADVDDALYRGLASGNAGLRNRGVKKAPFVVLIGANMPSILAEISFVTNPKDAAQLQTTAYRQRVAESLYHGVAKYAQGLSGMRVAKSSDKVESGGQ